MFSSNTETRISATYQDGDGTIDLVVDDMTTDTNTNQLTTFTLTADSGSNQTIAHGNTLDIAGGDGIATVVGSTDTVTVGLDIDGMTDINAALVDADLMIVDDGAGGTNRKATMSRLKTYMQNNLTFTTNTNTQLSTEQVQDIAGGMFSGNTETGITATYQDSDGTIDLVVGTLNQDTSGNAATATALETARNIGGVSFDGTANINLPGVNTAGNQNTSGTAAVATTVTVTDSTANTNFPVVFHDESNGLLDDTGALRYNPSTGTLLVPNLNVAGTTTTVDTVTMEAANAIVFEGATSDTNETTLTITDPTADRTITLPDATGTVALTSQLSDTQLSAEQVQDIVGAMFSSNTETRISATYQDGDGTIDLVVDDMTANDNTNQLTTFTLTGDSGSNQTIAHGNTLDIAGGDGIATVVGSTDTVTVGLDIDGMTDINAALADADLMIVDDGAGGTNRKATMSRLKTYMQNNLTFTTNTNTQLSNEEVQDIAGGMFSSNTETLITATYQDADGTIDLVVDNDLSNYDNSSSGFITATLTTEQVQDIVGAMFTSNTETNVSATYQDSDGTIDLVGTQMTFILEDDDGTEVSISDAEEIKFHSGNTSVDINYSDISPGSDADPFDLDFRTLFAPYLRTDDDRDFAPEDLANDIRELSGRFSTKTGIEDGSTTSASDYVDVLVLDTFTGHSGGDANILAFAKNSTKRIYHYRADQDDTNWGTASTVAYISDIPTNNNQLTNGAGFTTNTGTVTDVTVGIGLDVSNSTTTPTISIDLSEFTDMTAAIDSSQDELILLDNGAERRKLISEIPLSAFNNDSGFTTNTGDITGVDLTVTSPITIASETNTTSGSYSATLGLDDPANLSQLTESTDATTDKILLWDESASSWKYMTLDDLQDSIDTTGGGGGMSDLVDDTSPQLGGNLDTNSQNILIDDNHGIYDDSSNEQLLFGKTTSANAYIKIWNGISDTTGGTLFGTDVVHDSNNTPGAGRITGPGFEATGDQTDVGMSFKTKGLGQFVFTNTDSTADAAPVLNLMRNTADTEVSDDDDIGMIKFSGADSSMLEVGSETAIHDIRDYARIGVEIPDQTSGNADGEMYISILVKDSQRRLLAVGSNNLAHGDTPAAGVAAKAGQVRTFSGNQALDYDDYAGLYLIATSAMTFTLPADPNRGEQYVIISDTTGTVTIDRNGNTINGSSSNATITTRYEAKTFIATSSSEYIMLG